MANDLNRSIKIYIDNSDAIKKATDLTDKISSLQQSLQQLDAQGKKGTPEYTKKEKALISLQGSLSRYEQKVKDTERVLRNLSGATKSELIAVQRELVRSLKDVERGSDEYKAKLQALLAVKKELAVANKEERLDMGKQSSMWSRTAEGFNKYFGVVTSMIAGITGLSFTLRKLAQDNAAMDDVYSDVMKTTGNTRDEVLALNEAFKAMDTRTAREELNNLARDAGKLGLSSKKDILDFVEAGNQINVALGEDLGEGAIKNIGKLVNVFAKSSAEMEKLDLKGRMLATGSAINELGATSIANEQYLVTFAGRLGGIATQANISLQDILGFASGLDQNMQTVEMSATAFQKLIMNMLSDTEQFAKIAGMNVKDFNKLLKEDTNEALLTVLEKLGKKGGLQALIPVLKDMGLDAARTAAVAASLANNVDKVREAQRLSNEAFAKATSVTDEYDIKNNNLQAQLEKNRKAFSDAALALGERLNPALLTSTKWTTYLIKMLPSVLDFFEKYGRYILYVVGTYAAYVAGVKLVILYETLKNAVMTKSYVTTKAYIAITSLLSAGKALLTGNLVKARAAMLQFNTAVAMNPAGAAAAVVLALVAALGYLYWKTKDVLTVQKAVKEATEEMSGELAREQSEANNLFEVLKRVNPESDEYRKIHAKIITLYGPYLQGMTDEHGMLLDLAIAQEVVNTKIREQISLKTRNSATNKLYDASVKKQLSDMDSLMEKVDEQLKDPKYTKETSNAIRMQVDKTISEAVSNAIELKIVVNETELSKSIRGVLESEGVDIKNTSGWLTSQNINTILNRLSAGISESSKQIKEVKESFAGMISEATEKEHLLGGSGTTSTSTETDTSIETEEERKRLEEERKKLAAERQKLSEEEQKKLLAKQKKELDEMLETLETNHRDRLSGIKRQYIDGEIKTESEYNQKSFSQEQAYHILREQALEDYLKTVSDKELRSNITNQIASIQQKRLDDELKFRAQIEQIILDANPEAKEKLAYENRLRDVGLFGAEKEKLTADQLTALEFLEKQHEDNLLKIRNDAKKKEKAASEEKFTEDFKARKEQLSKELADEEQTVSVNIGIGALTGSDAFDAEVALQQKRIALIQEEVAARQRAGLDVSQLMKKQRSEELALTNLYVGEYKRRAQQCNQYAEQLGSALGNVLIGQEGALKSFANVVLDILFETLTSIINAKIAEATAVAIAEQAKAAAIAAAMPDSVATFGASAIARTAAIGAIIIGALSVAKSALKGLISGGKNKSGSAGGSNANNESYERVVDQRAQGKYDVIGGDDGRYYPGVSYKGSPTTGIVSHPTLYGEQGSELVVSHPDFKALQQHMNYPIILQALQDVRLGRTPQRADGKYDSINPMGGTSSTPTPSITSDNINLFLEKNIALLAYLRDNGVTAKLNYRDFEATKQKMDGLNQKTKR